MNWFHRILRSAGASLPGVASLLQLESDIDKERFDKQFTDLHANETDFDERLNKFEDPISSLHPDVPMLSKALYEALREQDRTSLSFDESFYSKYNKAIAVLHTKECIKARYGLGSPLASRIRLSDPSYIMYLSALFVRPWRMEELVKLVDECKAGEWLDGKVIAPKLNIPLCVVDACFKIYEARGLGLRPRTNGVVKYSSN